MNTVASSFDKIQHYGTSDRKRGKTWASSYPNQIFVWQSSLTDSTASFSLKSRSEHLCLTVCNLPVGVVLNARCNTNGCAVRIALWREQALLD